jgi:hypothetical protein
LRRRQSFPALSQIAYEALVGRLVPDGGSRTTVNRAVETVSNRYGQQPAETDEFLKPIVFSDEARIKGWFVGLSELTQ